MPVQDILAVLRRWFPYTVHGAGSDVDHTCPTLSPLLKHPGLRDLASTADVKPVLGAARMLSADSLLPLDHMVCELESKRAQYLVCMVVW
jgi:hypothetical protein